MQSVQSMCKCTCYVCLCCVWRFCIIYDEYPLMITAVCIHFTEHKSWTVREIDILGRRSLSNKARCLMDSFFFLLESPFFPFYYFSASSSNFDSSFLADFRLFPLSHSQIRFPKEKGMLFLNRTWQMLLTVLLGERVRSHISPWVLSTSTCCVTQIHSFDSLT